MPPQPQSSPRYRKFPRPGRRPAVVLLNGLLIDQAECWFRNLSFWRRSFEVHTPDLLVYDSPHLHERIAAGLAIDVDYLVEQLHDHVQALVRTPCALVASSLGAKVAIEYAVRFPDRVARLVLLGPSGLGGEERLPILPGVRRSDVRVVLESIFHEPETLDGTDPCTLKDYEHRFAGRRWRTGLIHTIRGTMKHCVREQLARVTQPTLVISGEEDRIISHTQAEKAARLLPRGWFLSLPRCGHAPHVEKPRLINHLVREFLTSSHAECPLLKRLLRRPAVSRESCPPSGA